MPRSLLAPALLAVLVGDLPAQEPAPLTLAPIVVTAARREQKLKDVVPATLVLGRRDIEQTGAGDVGAALAHVTGVQLEGGVPAGAGVMIEGLDSRRVLVLLDGQPVVGRLNGNLDLSRIPASVIERVEIVRGPQSVLYGSDAMGGVVNIITRAPTPRPGLTLALEGGSQDRRGGSATARGGAGAAAFVVNAGGLSEDLAPGRAGDAATFSRRWNVAPKLRLATHPGAEIELSGMAVDQTQRYRTGQLYHFSDNTQWAARLALVRRNGLSRFAPALSYSRFAHLSRASTAARPASDSGQRDVQQLWQAELGWSVPVPGSGVADAGLVVRHEAVRAERVAGGSRGRGGIEAYAQGTWVRGITSVSPGARVSADRRWGAALTPRLAVLVRPTPALALRAAAGTGFRTPDFKELYYDFANPAAGYAVRGNPALRPERSTNLSAGAELSGIRWFGRVSVFANRYRDFIDYQAPDADGTYVPGNIARGTTRGLEVEGGWSGGGARLEAGYALLSARNGATRTPLPGRAPHAGRIAASWSAGRARLSAAGQLTGRTPLRSDRSGAITAYRAAFARVDLRGAARVTGALDLTLAVENVLDRRMKGAWPGFTGRRIVAGGRLQLGDAER